ncbi:GGDEF domain-containing protein [Chitinibacteraceae bacterium HSL-7]
MPSQNPHELLQSLAEFTGTIDRDDLAVSLCLTLYELLPNRSIRFYRVVGPAQELRLGLLVEFCNDGMQRYTPDSTDSLIDIQVDALLHAALITDAPLHIAPTCDRVVMALHRQGLIYALADLTLKQPMSPADLRMFQGMARIYENHLALLDYGETDTLTGLLNRKTLERQFLKIVTALQALPGNPPLSSNKGGRRCELGPGYYFLAIFDIDHFKRINDQFGHLFGDEVLLATSQLMRRSFRTTDRLFRYGGEEFIVILGPQTRDGVQQGLERFREMVEEHTFPQVGKVTISGGVTDIRPFEVISMTLGRADQALYHAKESGRNQVIFHDTLPQQAIAAGGDELF